MGARNNPYLAKIRLHSRDNQQKLETDFFLLLHDVMITETESFLKKVDRFFFEGSIVLEHCRVELRDRILAIAG